MPAPQAAQRSAAHCLASVMTLANLLRSLS